jgi:hypothetical protein
METKETNEASLAGVGSKLLAHSKSAEFSAKRGLVVELFPFIFGASERMSSRAISQFLEKEQGIKLSSVTINKALKDPAKNWNLFFDQIEEAARTYAKADGVQIKDMLFKKKIFFKPVQNRVVQAAIKVLVKEDVVQAVRILRTKWEAIDWEIRLKARPYIEHRLGK